MEVLIVNEDCRTEVKLKYSISDRLLQDNNSHLSDLTCKILVGDMSGFFTGSMASFNVAVDNSSITLSDLQANHWYKAILRALLTDSSKSERNYVKAEIDFHTGTDFIIILVIVFLQVIRLLHISR